MDGEAKMAAWDKFLHEWVEVCPQLSLLKFLQRYPTLLPLSSGDPTEVETFEKCKGLDECARLITEPEDLEGTRQVLKMQLWHQGMYNFVVEAMQ